MTAARKLPPKPQGGWPTPPRYERGEITVRPREPAMQRECKRCGVLLNQQYLRIQLDEALPPTERKPENERSVWAVLPCTKCPLDLGVRA